MEISTERYVALLVKFLDEIGYREEDDPQGDILRERAERLTYVYCGTVDHFAHSDVLHALDIDSMRLAAAIRTATRMVVFGWQNLPVDVMLTLTIFFTHCVLGDDFREGPPHLMDSFVSKLLCGSEQSHPIWRLLLSFFPNVLRYYENFLQFTMFNGVLEFIQACWIERLQPCGAPGSTEYPMFLRRMSSLGTFCGASLFPAEQFHERGQFEGIITVVAYSVPIIGLVNDLFSFYKEMGRKAEDTSIVNNIGVAEGVSLEQALHKILDDSTRAIQELIGALEKMAHPVVLKTAHDFVRGYIRWHLCDERYRMQELSDPDGAESSAVKFRRFHEIACKAGCADLVDLSQLRFSRVPSRR